MKNIRQNLFRFGTAIFLTWLLSASVHAQGFGKYGAPFLSISPYARQVAMGEAFTALANDINVMRYNIGGLGNLRHIMFSTHFHKWIDDTQQGALEVALPWRFGVAGFNLTYFNEGEITELNEKFQQTGSIIGSNDLVLSFGYGGYLGLFKNTLSFGAGVKFIRQDLAGESATGTGIDVGLLYAMKHFSFGATVQNLTVSKIKFIDEEYLLPETLRGGLAARLPIGSKFKVNLGTDVAKVLGSSEKKLRVYSGGEVRVSDVFALRGGYKFHDTELSRWGAGFGVIIPMAWLGRSSAELDYAYSPMEAFDTQAHRFSLSFSFGAIQPVMPIAGMDQMQLVEMQQQVSRELEAAAEARKAAEEARLSAEETERRLKDLEAEMAARLEKVKQIAETSGGKIEIQPEAKGNLLMTLRINFDFDKAVIRPSEYQTMFKVADILQTYPEAKVQISGHTDNIGTDEYNMKLSAARMNSVMDFLTRHGIDRSRYFMPVAYGEWKPLTDNRTEQERFRNRRVEFYLYTGTNQPMVPEGSEITEVRALGDSTITVIGNGRLNYLTSFVDNPPRLILKFPKVYTPDPRTFPLNVGNFLQARMAYHPDERSTWVVFDMYAPMQPTWYTQDNRLLLPLRGGMPVTPTAEKRPDQP
ncbi:MAG: PorV/PorQ family protein [candidate division KSB1 bacterium]|nr:PorV/PorQ family protein [candidate division KSB1 bacterium]MDZ7303865.1 PorV/PorQ family protein [candidate division KSB1 bacterium]MDZ7313211.1 PorV/PorQ family protein [candidate division KSB1 bacterium]